MKKGVALGAICHELRELLPRAPTVRHEELGEFSSGRGGQGRESEAPDLEPGVGFQASNHRRELFVRRGELLPERGDEEKARGGR